MAKLYPPTIDNCVFVGSSISIPIEDNDAVDTDGVTYKLRVKQVNSGNLVEEKSDGVRSGGQVTFTLTKSYKAGQYYKIQVAYKKNNIVGYYSTVKLAFCTQAGTVTISNVDLVAGNITVSYGNDFLDIDQPIKCRIKVLQNDVEILDSGELKALKEFKDLFNGYPWTAGSYQVQIEVTTANGYVITPTPYSTTIGDSDFISINVTNDFDFGRITITPVDTEGSNLTYYLSRYSNINGEEKLYRMGQYDGTESSYDWENEQGVEYTYIARSDGYGILSDNDPSVLSDYEDMFLCDADKQLKLRFNPQVSSFKTTIQEQKIETIGNKYPRIFRNSAVGYKEFPINGMLARELDNKGDFWSEESEEPNRESTASSYSGSYSEAREYMAERVFKNRVLDWLNNGKPKLFKSPQEGMFIVQIMGASMAPIDTLGRKFHNVSMTAVEIADATPGAVKEYIGSRPVGVISEDQFDIADLLHTTNTELRLEADSDDQ